MRQHEYSVREDRVDRLVRDMTAAEVVDWLIEYHGLKESSRETAICNIEENQRFHRLRGRIDRSSALAAIVELWLRIRHGKAIAQSTGSKEE